MAHCCWKFAVGRERAVPCHVHPLRWRRGGGGRMEAAGAWKGLTHERGRVHGMGGCMEWAGAWEERVHSGGGCMEWAGA
eukprot:283829-Chlamydomonas_euryale.AAC.1